jgi:glycosyltransferase involved in cell wall biosynthesis
MPTALLEALARGKICIGSNNEGCREVLEGKPFCYLFPIGDEMKLVEIIKGIEK